MPKNQRPQGCAPLLPPIGECFFTSPGKDHARVWSNERKRVTLSAYVFFFLLSLPSALPFLPLSLASLAPRPVPLVRSARRILVLLLFLPPADVLAAPPGLACPSSDSRSLIMLDLSPFASSSTLHSPLHALFFTFQQRRGSSRRRWTTWRWSLAESARTCPRSSRTSPASRVERALSRPFAVPSEHASKQQTHESKCQTTPPGRDLWLVGPSRT